METLLAIITARNDFSFIHAIIPCVQNVNVQGDLKGQKSTSGISSDESRLHEKHRTVYVFLIWSIKEYLTMDVPTSVRQARR